MNKNKTKSWRQYEDGLEYKRKIRLYEIVRTNERFYRGAQWYGAEGRDLPKPVFNIIRRIIDYLVCMVSSGNISISLTDENLPFEGDKTAAEAVRRAVDTLSRNASYRWERARMDSKVYRLLTDAAISGDGILYCYWNSAAGGGQLYTGDIETEIIDNVNLFVADVNRADIQSQDYIILAGRENIERLRAEARDGGLPENEVNKIVADSETKNQSGDMAQYELEGDESNGGKKAVCIIKFWREDGYVVFEKSTREVVIRRQRTGQRLYPVAYFNWFPTKNSFHGTSPITGMIPNQKFINQAFAMVMKHMTDTAFSKVVYDKSRIPEWTNEVGEAIAATGGTNVADAVSVVGVGKMQEGYLELIELASSMTKELMGATESALGDGAANNTSAILALQEAARIPLEQVRGAYFQCIEDLVSIWADIICAYYPGDRLIPYRDGMVVRADKVDLDQLRGALLRARVDVGEISRFGTASLVSMLGRLLDGRHITAEQYIERLPAGIIADKSSLIEEIRAQNTIPKEVLDNDGRY